MSPCRIILEPIQSPIRLDLAIARHLAVGRTQVKKLLEAGHVRVNGRTANAKDKGLLLDSADVVEIENASPPAQQAIIPQPELPLSILREGDGWLAVDKPPGLPVHPLNINETGTLLNAAIARFPRIQGIGEAGLRSGVVHRLDVDTSGVILLATRQDVWQRLREAFAKHQISKTYCAIVEGALAGARDEVMELVVARHHPARVKVVPEKTEGSRRCRLSWRAMQPLTGATLIDVNLGTGFLHQIRAMMAHLGHPVVGDRVYGQSMRQAAPRQLLHAASLDWDAIHVHSPLPPDFAASIEQLKKA